MEPAKPVHYSNLSPGPEAQIDLKTWSRMYHLMCALSPWEETPAHGVSSDEAISVSFPVCGLMTEEGPVTSLSAAFTRNIAEGDEVHTRTGFELKFDLTRPGYVTVFEAAVGLPENIPRHTRFHNGQEPNEREPKAYEASTGDSIAFWEQHYVLSQGGAEEINEILGSADPAEVAQLDKRFVQALGQMKPPLYEACQRYFVQRKSLVIDPEAHLKPTVYTWGHLPTQSTHHPYGLVAEHWDKLVAYAPPGIRPSDSSETWTLMQSLPKDTSLWVRATWENDRLHGDYDPLFEAPTELKAVTLPELVKDLPDAPKEYVAKWVQDRLTGLRNWIAMSIGDVEFLRSMDEAEFSERKRAYDEDGTHFYWGEMGSWTVCLEHVLRGETYEKNVQRYAELEQRHAALYGEYTEAFPERLERKEDLSSSIWPDEDAKQDFLRKLHTIESKLLQRSDH